MRPILSFSVPTKIIKQINETTNKQFNICHKLMIKIDFIQWVTIDSLTTEIGTENISFKEGRKLANLEKTAWINQSINFIYPRIYSVALKC